MTPFRFELTLNQAFPVLLFSYLNMRPYFFVGKGYFGLADFLFLYYRYSFQIDLCHDLGRLILAGNVVSHDFNAAIPFEQELPTLFGYHFKLTRFEEVIVGVEFLFPRIVETIINMIYDLEVGYWARILSCHFRLK